jgi:hypothetical protein
MDKGELPTRSAGGITWEVVTDMQEMITRSGHYTALLETMGARGATKLHADEREQLLAVADALLFGDPDSEQGLARALDLIARLRESERRSPRGPERGGGARPPSTGSGIPCWAPEVRCRFHAVGVSSSFAVARAARLISARDPRRDVFDAAGRPRPNGASNARLTTLSRAAA